MAFIAIIVGIILLIKGGDWLMRSAVSLSLKLSIPKIVAQLLETPQNNALRHYSYQLHQKVRLICFIKVA